MSAAGMGRVRCMACGTLLQNRQSCPECEPLKAAWAAMVDALRAAERSFGRAHACRHLHGRAGKGVDVECECDTVRDAIETATRPVR